MPTREPTKKAGRLSPAFFEVQLLFDSRRGLARTNRRQQPRPIVPVGRQWRRNVPVPVEVIEDRILEARGLRVFQVALGRNDALELQQQAVDEIELADFLAPILGKNGDATPIFRK